MELAEAKLDELDGKLAEHKVFSQEAESSKTTNDSLQRKVQLLEEELDNAEKNAKDVVEKCAASLCPMAFDSLSDATIHTGSGKSTSRRKNLSVAHRALNRSVTLGKRSMR